MKFLEILDFQMTVINQGWFYRKVELHDSSTVATCTLNTRGFICSIVEQISGKWELTVVPSSERYSKNGNLFVASCLFVDPYEAVFAAYNAVAASDQTFPWKPYPDNAYF
jgi:hypothetical protein